MIFAGPAEARGPAATVPRRITLLGISRVTPRHKLTHKLHAAQSTPRHPQKSRFISVRCENRRVYCLLRYFIF